MSTCIKRSTIHHMSNSVNIYCKLFTGHTVNNIQDIHKQDILFTGNTENFYRTVNSLTRCTVNYGCTVNFKQDIQKQDTCILYIMYK